MPVGDQQPIDLLQDDEAWKREPVRLAEALGHDVKWDPATIERWTCTRCGCAVLRCGVNIYGSAVTQNCHRERGLSQGGNLAEQARRQAELDDD